MKATVGEIEPSPRVTRPAKALPRPRPRAPHLQIKTILVPLDFSLIRTGTAVDTICGEIGRGDIDLVVISTHGRTGFKRSMIGSVAEHVVRYAESPVLIVPSRGCSS